MFRNDGFGLNWTLSCKETVYGDSDVGAWISGTLLAEVIATRKATFQKRNSKGQVARGSKGDPVSLNRTKFCHEPGAQVSLGH